MNQRRRTRIESRKAVTLRSGTGERRGEIRNVSLRGCLVELAEQASLPPEDLVSVTIHLEPGSPDLDVTVKGRVVRTDPSQVAIQFTEVPAESFHHLFRFVQYNAPDPEGIEKELGSSVFDVFRRTPV
jgi:hypothetical protein